MKNREKFREEILKNARAIGEVEKVSACEFINRDVFPTFGDEVSCSTINCAWCKFLLGIWLDEEYEEPPKPEVDWSKVPVDTLVRVRDFESDKWTLRYFKGLSRTPSSYPPGYNYEVWALGATSVTAEGDTERWKYCEFVEDEDNDK